MSPQVFARQEVVMALQAVDILKAVAILKAVVILKVVVMALRAVGILPPKVVVMALQ